MEIHLKKGIGEIKFGMTPFDVEKILGQPDVQKTESDGDLIHQYNSIKTRLIFFGEEDFKLGFIESSNPKLTFENIKLIGEDSEATMEKLSFKIKEWDSEESDFLVSSFNEANEMHVFAEYGSIIEVSMGVTMDEEGEDYVWAV